MRWLYKELPLSGMTSPAPGEDGEARKGNGWRVSA